MARGTIIRIDRAHGVGTIRPDDGTHDIGFHHSAVVGRASDQLEEGQRVEFVRRSDLHTPRRALARNIGLLTDEPGQDAGETP
jgi:cold shock CspA family protein